MNMKSARLDVAVTLCAMLALTVAVMPVHRTDAQEAGKASAALAGKRVAFVYLGGDASSEVVGQVESVDAHGFSIQYEMGLRDAKKQVTVFLPWTSVKSVRLLEQK
jgi:hypothetical protein